MNQNIGNLGKKETSISGMRQDRSMPSPRISQHTSPLTSKSLIISKRFYVMSTAEYFLINHLLFERFLFGIINFVGPYFIDMLMRTCHWAPGSSAWKSNTLMRGPCVVALHLVISHTYK